MVSKGISEEGISKLQPLFTLSGSFESQIESFYIKEILPYTKDSIEDLLQA